MASLARPLGLAVPFVLLLGSGADAQRLALLVGNSSYQNVAPLAHPAPDAGSLADALRRLDFEVTLLTDATAADIAAALDAFQQKASREDTESTLFYFAGHGFQSGGANFLVPTDGRLADAQATAESLPLDVVIGKVTAASGQTLVFLDASQQVQLPAGVPDSNKGLAAIGQQTGLFTALSSQPDTVAPLAEGANSPFTAALLANIGTPGSSISDMMTLVRLDVDEATGGKQKPWDQSKLRSQFYFLPEYDTSAALTSTDYEMLADLDPEIQAKLLALLTETGVSLEIEALEEATLQLASIEQTVIIEAVEDEPAAVTGDGQGLRTASVTPSLEIIAMPEDTPEPVAVATATPSAADVTMAAAPDISVASAPVSSPVAPTVPASVGVSFGADVATATALPSTAQPTAPGSAESPADRVIASAVIPAAPAIVGTTVATATAATPEPVASEPGAIVLASVDPARVASAPDASARITGQEVLPDAPSATEAAAPESVEIEIPDNVPMAVQTELARLGCYRSAIDGIWGKGSALSLVRYYSAKKTAPDTLQPTPELYVALKGEENVVCKLSTTTAKIPTVRKTVEAAPVKKTKRIITSAPAVDGAKPKTIKRINSGVFR